MKNIYLNYNIVSYTLLFAGTTTSTGVDAKPRLLTRGGSRLR